jgi:hypothetical protein
VIKTTISSPSPSLQQAILKSVPCWGKAFQLETASNLSHFKIALWIFFSQFIKAHRTKCEREREQHLLLKFQRKKNSREYQQQQIFLSIFSLSLLSSLAIALAISMNGGVKRAEKKNKNAYCVYLGARSSRVRVYDGDLLQPLQFISESLIIFPSSRPLSHREHISHQFSLRSKNLNDAIKNGKISCCSRSSNNDWTSMTSSSVMDMNRKGEM